MKKSLVQACVLSCLLASCTVAGASFEDVQKSASQNIRSRKYVEAISQARQGLTDASLTSQQKLTLLKLINEASRLQGYQGTSELFESSQQILAMPEASSDDKAQAYLSLSRALRGRQGGFDMKDMDATEALNALENALKLPGLSDNAKRELHLEAAELYYMVDQYDKARPHFEQVAQSSNARISSQGHDGIVSIIAAQQGADKARQYVIDNKLDLLSFIQRYGSTQELEAHIRKIVSNTSLTPQERWQALLRSPGMSPNAIDMRELISLLREYGADIVQQDPKLASGLINRLRRCVRFSQYEFVSVAAPLMLSTPTVAPKTKIELENYMLDGLAWQGKLDELLKLAQSLSQESQASDAERAKAALVVLALQSKQGLQADAIKNAVASLNRKDQLDTLTAAGRVMLRGGLESQARAIWDYYSAQTQLYDQVTVLCRFDEQAPIDLGTWLNSPAVARGQGKWQLDKLYGDNLKALLETDATNTGRGVDADATASDQDTRTDLYMACDAHGLTLFIRAFDSQAELANQGVVRAGSYEMYLAPGVRQPYHTFLAPLNSSNWRAKALPAMYPNRFYRDLSPEDGNLSGQTRVLPDGFATCISITWDAFYDKLPAPGEPWQLEIIRWTRAGGRSLAGSKSVHNRSSWALLEFENMTPANLTQIKRGIIPKALARYAKAKGPMGAAGHWEDRELGDPAFYAAKVKPLINELDKYLIKPGQKLSDEDVNRIFAQAVPGWMELEFIVAEMRRDYLSQQLMKE